MDERSPSEIEQILARPASERLREFKYRFSQSAVFGLPVMALHFFGQGLGGDDAPRWTGLLQVLLAGWVMYVGAFGALFEGLILLRRGTLPIHLLIALAAITAYLYSTFTWIMSLGRGTFWPTEPLFFVSVLIILLWTGLGWAWLSRSTSPTSAHSRSD